MPRSARVVAVGAPQHVTQRGNNRQKVFHSQPDHQVYLALLAGRARQHACRILAYCLMPNHVHLVVIPDRSDVLARDLDTTTGRDGAGLLAGRGDVPVALFPQPYRPTTRSRPHPICQLSGRADRALTRRGRSGYTITL